MNNWFNHTLMLHKSFDCRSPWLYPDFIYGLTANGRENKRLTKYVHNFADEIIQSRRTALVRIWDQTFLMIQLSMTNLPDKLLLYILFVTNRKMIQIYLTNAEKIFWTFLSQLETKTARVWQPRKSELRSIPFYLKVVSWFQIHWKFDLHDKILAC